MSVEQKYGAFSPELVRLVPPGSRVLDVGCSTGALAAQLKAKQCRVVGLDFDPDSLAEASRHCVTVYRCNLDDQADVDRIPADEGFDVITMGDVLEHLKYPGVVLNSLRRLLRPNGVLLASIPNAAFILLRVKFLFGDFAYQPGGGLMDEDHLRFFSFRTVRILLDDAGYAVEGIHGVSIVKRRYFFLPWLCRLLPGVFAIHIIVQARKK